MEALTKTMVDRGWICLQEVSAWLAPKLAGLAAAHGYVFLRGHDPFLAGLFPVEADATVTTEVSLCHGKNLLVFSVGRGDARRLLANAHLKAYPQYKLKTWRKGEEKEAVQR